MVSIGLQCLSLVVFSGVDFAFEVLAMDGSADGLNFTSVRCGPATLTVHVTVQDENDELPVFADLQYLFSVTESTDTGLSQASNIIGRLLFDHSLDAELCVTCTPPSLPPIPLRCPCHHSPRKV